MFKSTGVNNLFGPFKRLSLLVTSLSEGVYGVADIANGVRIESSKRPLPQDAKPDLHLVEPGGMGRRVMEMDLGMLGRPSVVLGLVGIEIVKNNMEFRVRILGYDLIHKVQEIPAAATSVVGDMDLASCHFERSEQCRGAMALVLVAKSPECLPVGEAKPSLGTFQSLNGRFLVDTNNHRVLRWIQVQPYDVSRFPSKLGVSAYTPTSPSLQMDSASSEHPPDVMRRHIPQRPGQESARPRGMTFRRWCIQFSQYPFLCLNVVFGCLAWAPLILEPR